MSKLEQHTDLNWYPTEGFRREYRRTVYGDGMVTYDLITETDRRYSSVEVTEERYYELLYKAKESQRKKNARRSDA